MNEWKGVKEDVYGIERIGRLWFPFVEKTKNQIKGGERFHLYVKIMHRHRIEYSIRRMHTANPLYSA
jgi:hypothetical protein